LLISGIAAQLPKVATAGKKSIYADSNHDYAPRAAPGSLSQAWENLSPAWESLSPAWGNFSPACGAVSKEADKSGETWQNQRPH
jgi:hypothetical protein